METRTKTGISLETTVFEAMEKARGLIPRSTYINELIKRAIPAEFPARAETAASTQPVTEGADNE